MPLVSISEAARATGVSRMQIYRLKDRGALAGWCHRDEKGRPLIELAGLREHLANWSRIRIDSFHLKAAPAPEPAPEPEPDDDGEEFDLEVAAAYANGQLEPSSWGPPPWPWFRWVTLASVWRTAEQLAKDYGEFLPEVLADDDLEGGSDE